MYRNFSDFAQIRPLGADYLVGFRPNQGEFKVDFYTISNLISGGLWETPNVLFVTVSGNDANIGIAENYPFRTIKRACQYASQKPQNNYTIFVKSGTYYERNPVYVPKNTTIQGDNLRRVAVIPTNLEYDIFWVTNADYLWGMTFRNHQRPSAAIAFPNLDNTRGDYAAAFNTPGYTVTPPTTYSIHDPRSPLYITTSPYIQGCSSITRSLTAGADNAGCGMRVDGSLVGGYLRSMVLDSYTQLNEGGEGIVITNNGYAQLVSIFTVACTTAVLVSAGGGCDINTSNASFGLSGLAAFGKSNFPILTGTLIQNVSAGTNSLVLSGVTPSRVAAVPARLMVFNTNLDSTLYTVSSALSSNVTRYRFQVESDEDLNVSLPKGTTVNFYLRSTILASAYTMENVGAGTVLAQALPVLGGKPKPENEVCERDGGKIFVTLTNEEGDFKVGTDFTIRQATGTIEGRTFQRSIFSLITPFVLSIE